MVNQTLRKYPKESYVGGNSVSELKELNQENPKERALEKDAGSGISL